MGNLKEISNDDAQDGGETPLGSEAGIDLVREDRKLSLRISPEELGGAQKGSFGIRRQEVTTMMGPKTPCGC